MNFSKTSIICICFFVALCTVSCVWDSSMQKSDRTPEIFPKGEEITNGYFTGHAFLRPLLNRDKNHEFSIGSVYFEPGARTNWHTHPKGQVLLVTEGEGLYQQKGKPAQVIKKGDVVNIPENVEHWHGAKPEIKMVHIAISNYKNETNVHWMDSVTTEEYLGAAKSK